MSKEESLAYELHVKAYLDNQSVIATAEARGRAEGKAERDIEIARRMKQEGLDTP